MSRQVEHQRFSGECFNEVWDLLENPTRSPEDNRLMREMAHASLFHWLKRSDCEPSKISIGLWQIARVYAALGQGRTALDYAEECIELSEEHGLPPFYLGYGFEAAARAAGLLEDGPGLDRYLQKAGEMLANIADAQEREMLAKDLDELENRRK